MIELDRGQKRALVDRVANSGSFQRSPRLRAFLLYVADCALNDRPEDAREQQIAQNVFNRKADYNPGQDNIVRVEARSLRKRLETYFATEGKEEPYVIVMPRGSYSVGFEPRPAEAPEPVPLPPEPPPQEAPRKRRWLRPAVVVGIVLVLGWVGIALTGRTWRHAETVRILPFSAFIDNQLETYVVTSDTCLVIVQELTGQHVTLKDYMTGRYPGVAVADPVKQEMIRFLLDRNYTDANEAAIAGKILQLHGSGPHHMQLRSAHKVQLSDFQNHNLILLGGTISNPWTKLYFEKLNFQYDTMDVPSGQSVVFRNRSPKPGEQKEYYAPTRSGQSGEAYASVALVPNASGPGSVLIIAGTTAESTAAAGDFALDADRMDKALRQIGVDPFATGRYFELFLKAMTFPGGATQASLVAWRIVQDTK